MSSGIASANRWRLWRASLAVLVGATIAAVGFDLWYRDVLLSRERQRVVAYATPYASALESAVGRRVARLAGLRTFAQTRASVAQLQDEFPTFADGLRAGAPGIRALELVRNGRITAVVPLDSNPNVLGYDLYSDVRPSIPGDVRRAIETGAVTITGPIELLQGGQGFIVRQRVVRPRATLADSAFPDLVAMVLDLPTLIAEAATFSQPTTLSLVVLDRRQEVLSGGKAPLDDPMYVPIRVPDGGWTLLAAPPEGWAASIADDLRPTRIASAMIVLLLAGLAYIAAGRQQHLRVAVEEQTQELRGANEALTRQVHEREAAEQRLREGDERLRLALTSGHMGTWDYQPDLDQLHLSAGALAILGTPLASMTTTGRSFCDGLPPEARELIVRAAKLAIAGGDCRAEYRIVLPSGEDRWLYSTGELQSDPDGSPRLVGVIMDVTERRRLEEQLLHSQKMEAMGTLAGGIAHDFNNLLTAILGFARLSQQQAEAFGAVAVPKAVELGLNDLRADLDEIVKAGERAALLTAQLLAFSRRQVVKLARVDLSGVVFDVERMLKRLIGERIVLVTQHSPSPLIVRADAGQLAQVAVNLVVNARDAMPDGGTIRVRTESVVLPETGEPPMGGLPSGRWCVLSVSDDGVGMSTEISPACSNRSSPRKRWARARDSACQRCTALWRKPEGRCLSTARPTSARRFGWRCRGISERNRCWSRRRRPTPGRRWESACSWWKTNPDFVDSWSKSSRGTASRWMWPATDRKRWTC
ncbi:MAG: CHASE domain-containing protein [Gemmatimonadaceae bacterium]|nr:CHASE domain-containing protein [Gemmatimonadaceae bacterium]